MLTPPGSSGDAASAGSAARVNDDTRTHRKPMLMDMPVPLSKDSSARRTRPSSGVDWGRGEAVGSTVNPHQGETDDAIPGVRVDGRVRRRFPGRYGAGRREGG